MLYTAIMSFLTRKTWRKRSVRFDKLIEPFFQVYRV